MRRMFLLIVWSMIAVVAAADTPELTVDDLRIAQRVAGLSFTEAELDSLLGDVRDYVAMYETLRKIPVANSVRPSLVFNPLPVGFELDRNQRPQVWSEQKVSMPDRIDDLAFYTVAQLSALVRERKVTSVQLTELFIKRLQTFGDRLECVVTITEARAMAQARQADKELAEGVYRGPLHGIPYGAKDLLAVPGFKTTWGAEPYREQVIDDTATVIARLDEAGAVLVAKLTLGALAWGDVWYGGLTRNPWDLEQGSSGSSAGSASATAAGLVPFAIGTETWGSIVSPSTRCGTTGLRPTFGRVSRAGAMALSWSMDKIGPICRSVEDCAMVFDAIRGSDGKDPSVVDAAFNWDAGRDPGEIRIGYIAELFDADYPGKARDQAVLEVLRSMGFELMPISMPEFDWGPLSLILTVEAAAAFDDLTRSNRDDLLVRQIKNAWPNVFRGARFVPAVEYIQANRIRYQIIQAMADLPVDVYMCPSFGGNNLLLTNLTGHPSVVLPNGFDDTDHPTSITMIGRLFGEAPLMLVAKAYQDATGYHRRHPKAFQ